MYIYHIYITYINVGYITHIHRRFHIYIYIMWPPTPIISGRLFAQRQKAICQTPLLQGCLILDTSLTRNFIIPCLINVKNIFHHASSKAIIKNFSQQISRKCIIKLRASFTQHFWERGGWELRPYPSLSLNLRRLETLDARFSYNFKQPNVCRKHLYPAKGSES